MQLAGEHMKPDGPVVRLTALLFSDAAASTVISLFFPHYSVLPLARMIT
jgi:hypothetical protein